MSRRASIRDRRDLRIAWVGIALAIWIPLVPLAAASDGVREISQACAHGPGCFSGDGPGLPVTIDGSAGRSYRLTSDLARNASVASSVHIDITASDVTLDLNHFTLDGCADASCSTLAAATGIVGSGPGVAIRNGRLRRFTSSGIQLPAGQALIERVAVAEVPLLTGIAVGPGSIVEASGASSSVPASTLPVESALITVGSGSIVRGSSTGLARFGVAIRAESGSLVQSSRVLIPLIPSSPFARRGISVGQDSRLTTSLVNQLMPGVALETDIGASVVHNVVSGNASVGGSSHVQGNPILLDRSLDASFALTLGAATTYRENIIAATVSGADPVGGALFLNMGENTCDESVAACP